MFLCPLWLPPQLGQAPEYSFPFQLLMGWTLCPSKLFKAIVSTSSKSLPQAPGPRLLACPPLLGPSAHSHLGHLSSPGTEPEYNARVIN